MRHWILWACLCLGASAAQADGGLDIYFVRHAQTLANATGVNNSGNSNLFSELGQAQIEGLTPRLRELHFDAILVSSAERAMNTVLPYLRETGQVAEVWPEIAECCWQKERGDLASGRVLTTSKIELPPDSAAYFKLRDASGIRNYGNINYADGVAQVRYAEALLKERFYNSGKTILIVAHYHSGQVLLGDLLGRGRDALPNLENAEMAHLRQEADGRFTLLMINDRVVGR